MNFGRATSWLAKKGFYSSLYLSRPTYTPNCKIATKLALSLQTKEENANLGFHRSKHSEFEGLVCFLMMNSFAAKKSFEEKPLFSLKVVRLALFPEKIQVMIHHY